MKDKSSEGTNNLFEATRAVDLTKKRLSERKKVYFKTKNYFKYILSTKNMKVCLKNSER